MIETEFIYKWDDEERNKMAIERQRLINQARMNEIVILTPERWLIARLIKKAMFDYREAHKLQLEGTLSHNGSLGFAQALIDGCKQ